LSITVYYSPNHLDELALRDKNIVVIDVLRASTTIVYAMRSGAREVIPVGSVAQAMKIVGSMHSTSILLCGEKGGKRVEGFNLGNSPLEYTPAAVEGKGLILSTTNGSVALTKAKHARLCYVAGFVNLSATIEALAQIKNLIEDGLTIICSGREEDFSLEDATCAGMLISKISSHPDLGPRLNQSRLTDSARAALSIFYEYGNDIYRTLRSSDHGELLAELGFEEDIRIASEIDSIPLVPVLEQTAIKKKLIFSQALRDEIEGRPNHKAEKFTTKAKVPSI